MKFHEVEMAGKYWMQIVSNSDIASHSAADEGRLVYNRDDGGIYYADSLAWNSLQETALTVHREDFVSTSGQTVFNLSFGYSVGTNELTVYSNNVLMIPGVDYVETDGTTVTFLVGRALNEPVSIITTDAFTSTFRHETTATSLQTVFNLPWDYIPGSGNLLVFANNFLMVKDTDYTETDSDTITFLTGRALDEPITFIYYDNILNDLIKFGENLGSGVDGEVVFAGKSGNTLQFKRVKSGNGVGVTAEANDILLEIVEGEVTHNNLAGIQGSGNYHVSQDISEGLVNSPTPVTAGNPVATQADIVPVGAFVPAVIARAVADVGDIVGAPTGNLTLSNVTNVSTVNKTNPAPFRSRLVVTFSTALSTSDYVVLFNVHCRAGGHVDDKAFVNIDPSTRTVNGFNIELVDPGAGNDIELDIIVMDPEKLGVINQPPLAWDYDSGWIADFGATNDQTFNHNLGTDVFSNIVIQMRDGNGIPIQFNGTAIAENRVPGEYNRGYGPRVTIPDNNNVVLDCPQYGGAARWLPDHTDVPPGWAGTQPTQLRILLRV